ncbi:MAG: hypothetical protein FJ299_15325, partial [Planctomycetes bacterium]|nr:hypothetical protein [Planctomycetota bacterium]
EDLRGAPAAGQDATARERQAQLALLEAQWLAGLGRVENARTRLAEARTAAVSPALQLELQLFDFALVPAQRHAERAALLDALAALPGELEMPEAALQRHAEQSFGGALELSPAQQPALDQGMALATWCGLMRAASARERGDAAAAQLALQQLLLDDRARPDLDALELWPLIARALRARAASHQVALPALYEERAQRERVELGSEATSAQLLELCRRYPLSAAATRAREQLCADWQRATDIPSLAALARELRLGAAQPDAAESVVLRALAAALRETGNQELARAFAALDGRPAPAQRSDEPQPSSEAAPPLLGHALSEVLELERPTRLLGRWRALAPGEEDSDTAAVRDLVLLWRDGRIEAWDERSPGEPLWTAPLYSVTPPAAVVASAGRVACVLDSTLVGLDLWSGALAWSARLADEEEVALCAVDGVVVASSIVAGIARLQGFEARGGAELWRVTTAEQRAWRAPLAGEGRVVLLACSRPDVRLLDGRMLVIDALRGIARGDFQLGLPLDAANADEAWIAAGRLCLPRFYRTRPSDEVLLRGIDLDDGSLAFSVRAEQGAELDALLEYRGARTLVTRMGRRAGAEPGGALLSFDPASGSAATLLRLRFGERVIGASSTDTLRLVTPHVCICLDGARPDVPFTFVELGRGVRWMQRLPLGSDEPDWDGMPAPLIGARGVLLAWGRSSSIGGRRQLFVSQYDRESGVLLEQQDWSGRAGSSRLLEWTAVGSTVLATLDEERFLSLESRK